MWISYSLLKWCPFCGMLLFEQFIEGDGMKVKRKKCSNPNCFFICSKNYGLIRVEVDEGLIKSIPTIPSQEEEKA